MVTDAWKYCYPASGGIMVPGKESKRAQEEVVRFDKSLWNIAECSLYT
jgi:hypothetical protein